MCSHNHHNTKISALGRTNAAQIFCLVLLEDWTSNPVGLDSSSNTHKHKYQTNSVSITLIQCYLNWCQKSKKGKGKAIPLQALTGPEGSRRLRLPDFKTIGTWRWQGCQPVNIPGTHFCRRLSRPQGHSAAERIMSMKNSNDTTGNRSRDLPVRNAVP
jgi:hypothetical protein